MKYCNKYIERDTKYKGIKKMFVFQKEKERIEKKNREINMFVFAFRYYHC